MDEDKRYGNTMRMGTKFTVIGLGTTISGMLQ